MWLLSFAKYENVVNKLISYCARLSCHKMRRWRFQTRDHLLVSSSPQRHCNMQCKDDGITKRRLERGWDKLLRGGRTFKQISLRGKQRYWSRTIDIVHIKNDVNIILISFEINEIRNYNNLNGFCSFSLHTHIRIWHINRFDMKIWSGALIKTQWMRWIKFKMENEFK